jgi:glutamyl-tRNA synthetase
MSTAKPQPSGTVARLAPSPTGAQHLGNARTFLLAWLSARSSQGRLLLRIEDIDSPRIKSWAIQQALDDLKWLGLDWDEGPDRPGPAGPYLQTERLGDYRSALDDLRQRELIYPCTCTRSDVAEAASAPHWEHEGPVYPRTCTHRTVADSRSFQEVFAWRFRCLEGLWSFNDGYLGKQTCSVATELGDFIVAKKDGSPAYQLAVVADDHAMQVTEVVRGDDLLASTFRQLQLYSVFGWSTPRYYHLPLVVGPDGRRLAKRHGDSRLSHYRDLQVPPERVLGLLAHSIGLLPTCQACTASELVDSFQWDRLSRQSCWQFTQDHESWLLGKARQAF